MPEKEIQTLIEGGKATAGPPLGPQLGPLGVNITEIVDKINQKTKSVEGMKVPVKLTIDPETKEYEIEVGTPPTAALLKKEAKIEKGSPHPKVDHVADLIIEQIIKTAKTKEDSLTGKTLKQKVKEVVGTCNSLGILVEGKKATETIKDIDQGKYDQEIKEEKTEITEEERKKLEKEREELKKEMEERRQEFLEKAQTIMDQMAGHERKEIKGKLTEEGIPTEIIEEVLPTEKAEVPEGAPPEAPGEAPEGAPETGEEKTKKEEKEE